MEWRRSRLVSFKNIIYFACVLFMFNALTTPAAFLDIYMRCPFSGKAGLYSQEGEKRRSINGMIMGRKLLSGPGSSPPRCTSKCGKCSPCKPVHVPVPPGTPVTAEYYPEAWRCKCGNKLFMP